MKSISSSPPSPIDLISSICSSPQPKKLFVRSLGAYKLFTLLLPYVVSCTTLFKLQPSPPPNMRVRIRTNELIRRDPPGGSVVEPKVARYICDTSKENRIFHQRWTVYFNFTRGPAVLIKTVTAQLLHVPWGHSHACCTVHAVFNSPVPVLSCTWYSH
jgi:hypothetical protein